jgi:hypothetical protein
LVIWIFDLLFIYHTYNIYNIALIDDNAACNMARMKKTTRLSTTAIATKGWRSLKNHTPRPSVQQSVPKLGKRPRRYDTCRMADVRSQANLDMGRQRHLQVYPQVYAGCMLF